ncbi:MogA/MoaB family molybdenum cofactor biosynthesis protein [Tessaracoccus sp. Z1128]
MSYRAAVITCSDRASTDVYEDRSGPLIRDALTQLGFDVAEPVIVPDEAEVIATEIRLAVADGARVVITTGGTGVGPRDVTVEATRSLISYEVPGVAEAVRSLGSANTPLSWLSRGLAGVIDHDDNRAFVYNAPGSRGGARDALSVLAPLLAHIVDQLDGADHDLNRPSSTARPTVAPASEWS